MAFSDGGAEKLAMTAGLRADVEEAKTKFLRERSEAASTLRRRALRRRSGTLLTSPSGVEDEEEDLLSQRGTLLDA